MSEASTQTQLIRRTSVNVVAVASSQLVGKIATLAWLLVATRTLDQAAFGAFSFALALALLVGSFVEWGFTAAMVQRSSRDPKVLNRFYTSAQVWQLALGVPAYALAVFAAKDSLQTPGAWWVLLAAVVATASETWCSTARSAASVLQRQGRVSIALTIQRLLIAACAIGGLVLGGNVTSLALGFLIGTALGVPIHSLALRRVGIHLSIEGLRVSSLRPLLSASHYIGLSGVVLVGLAKVDQVLLGVLANEEAVGAYAAAYRLLETVFFIAFALQAALFPVLAADPRPQFVRNGLRAAWEVLCFAYIPYVVVCLLAPAPVLRLVFGEPYDESAAAALQWLSVVPLLFAGAYLVIAALLAVDRQRWILGSAVAALVVTVVGDLLLIPPYGPAGAAAGTVVGYAVQLMVAGVALHRYTGLPRMLPGLALAGTAGVILGTALLVLPLGLALTVGIPLYLITWYGLVRWLAPARLIEAIAVLPSSLSDRLEWLRPDSSFERRP